MTTDNSNGKVYNVCGEKVHQMQYYTDCLINASSIDYNNIEQKIYPPFYRDIDIQIQIGDITELKNDTNWEPLISLEQTMEDLLQYWIKKLS